MLSPDGSKLAAQAGGIGTITVWDANSYAELMTLPGHTGVVADIAFSPDSQRLAFTDGAKQMMIGAAVMQSIGALIIRKIINVPY